MHADNGLASSPVHPVNLVSRVAARRASRSRTRAAPLLGGASSSDLIRGSLKLFLGSSKQLAQSWGLSRESSGLILVCWELFLISSELILLSSKLLLDSSELIPESLGLRLESLEVGTFSHCGLVGWRRAGCTRQKAARNGGKRVPGGAKGALPFG